jgi:hypothetical protein
MRRILWALGAATVLLVTALAPAADAAAPATSDGRVTLVTLGPAFSPSSVTLRTGHLLLVTVDPTVSAAVAVPAPGGPLAGGELGPGAYLLVATRPGVTILTAIVRPRCVPGSVCPQWIAVPRLEVTVSP